MKLPAYPRYKRSGVEWLGDVPEHWEVKRLDFLASVKARLGWKGLTASEYVPEGFIFLATPNIKGEGDIDFENVNYITAERYYESPEIMIRVGDVLMAKDGSTLGTTNVVRHLPAPATVNSSVAVLRPRPALASSYFFRWLTSAYLQSLIQSMKDGQGVPHLFQADIRKFPVLLPPFAEQLAIAAFLDRETGRLDRLVAKKRELIERLKEKRTALISSTVTRGLPPAPPRAAGVPVNPPLKPSGLDWLGDIPQHWEVCKLKRVTISRCDGPFGSGLKSEHYTDDGVRVIRLQNIRFAQFDGSDAAFIEPEYYEELGDHSVLPGDLLIAGLGDENHPVGRACVAPSNLGPAMVKADCFRFRLNPKRAAASYLALQLSTTAGALAGALATGTTRGRMNLSATESREVTLPPLSEQIAIVAYLKAETAKLDTLVAKVEAAVERLQEYRTALITAAVTGKIDVRAHSR